MNMQLRYLLLPLISACGLLQPHVPASMKGNIPIVVRNGAGYALCDFALQPSDGPVQNWVAGYQIKIGESFTFNIKPGTYELHASTCALTADDGTDRQSVADGSVNAVTISGPTFVAFGDAAAGPAGYAVVHVPARGHYQ
jgi:hypothetical protein